MSELLPGLPGLFGLVGREEEPDVRRTSRSAGCRPRRRRRRGCVTVAARRPVGRRTRATGPGRSAAAAMAQSAEPTPTKRGGAAMATQHRGRARPPPTDCVVGDDVAIPPWQWPSSIARREPPSSIVVLAARPASSDRDRGVVRTWRADAGHARPSIRRSQADGTMCVPCTSAATAARHRAERPKLAGSRTAIIGARAPIVRARPAGGRHGRRAARRSAPAAWRRPARSPTPGSP